MKGDLDGINCIRHKYLEPVLKKWISIVKESSRYWNWKDCPWWYNERATLSTLAGAVWRTGGICLEEYVDHKIYRNSSYKGRCDLYFRIGKHNIIIEAKQCWPNAGSRAYKTTTHLEDTIRLAKNDIKCLYKGDGKRLGAIFVSPRIPYSERHIVDERIDNIISNVIKLKVKSFAYTFPGETRYLFDKEDNKYIYPGVILLIN